MNRFLKRLGLNPNNSIVIGSGILQALKIRKSGDIDMVVTQEAYDLLRKSGKFTISENHGREILADDTLEIGANWIILGKAYNFEDFKDDSVVIDGVRYITINFLYKAKKSWLKNDDDVREKDIKDIELIEGYLETHK